MISRAGFFFLGTGQVVWVSDTMTKLVKSTGGQWLLCGFPLWLPSFRKRMSYEDAGSGVWLPVETLLLTRQTRVFA